MSTNLPFTVLATGMLLLAEAIRRRTHVPRYVHIVAVAVGAVSALILWRAGGLYAGGVRNAITLLVPSAAIYYFFFQSGAQHASRDSEPGAASSGQARDRDV